jgi:hypothetical protein
VSDEKLNPFDLLMQILGQQEESEQTKAIKAQVESAHMLRRQIVETYDEGLSTQLKILGKTPGMTMGGLCGYMWECHRRLVEALDSNLEESIRTVVVKLETHLRDNGFQIHLDDE